jgi:tetratricopeptide (TPR) repeat protein
MKIKTSHRRTGLVLCVLIACLSLAACSSSPEAKSAKFMDAGKKFLVQKDPNRAIIQFRNAAQATPNRPEIYYQLALAYLDAKDIRQGVLALRKAVEIDPKHQAAQLKLSQLMASVNDPEILKDARERLEGVLQNDPASGDALHALALTELKLGDTKDGMQHLQQAVAAAPQELRIAVTLAQAKLQQGDAKGAEEALKKLLDLSPKRSEIRTTLADFYVSQKRYPDAEAQLKSALELDPKSTDALLSLGRLQYALGRKQEAEQTFKRAAGFDQTRIIYGVFLSTEGRTAEAISEFERLYKANNDDRQARTSLVLAYYKGGRAADGQRILADALKRNGKDIEALFQRGELYLESREYSQSEADLSQVLKMKPDAPEVHYVLAKLYQAQGKSLLYRQELSDALKLNPFLAAIRAEAARELVSSGNPQAGLDLLNAAPGDQKNSVALITERNWAFWYLGKLPEMRASLDQGLAQMKTSTLLLQDGLWKLRSGQTAAAKSSLEAALNVDPTDVRALAALRQSIQGPGATQKVKDYAGQNPKSAPVQEYLGIVLVANGDRVGARKAFEASKAADPNFVNADMRLVQVDVLDQKFDDARTRLQKLISAGKGNPRLELWLANLEVVKGNYDAALALYQKVVAEDPTNAAALNNLAYLLADYAKRPDDALKYAEKAVELAPTDPNSADTLGWILYQKGLYSNSLQYLELAAASSKGSVVSKYHLAMAYAKAGQQTKSKATLDAALKLDPKRPEARLAQELVRKSN